MSKFCNHQLFRPAAAALLLLLVVQISQADELRFVSKSLEAFTEPYRTLQVAAPEAGRVAKIHVQRGTRVKQGDLLVELDNSVLQAAKKVAEQKANTTARLEAARVEFDKANRRYQTLKGLANEGVGTKEELVEAEANARVAELGVTAVEEELQQFALELAEIEARIEQRRIRADIDGIVTEIHKEASEYVSPSQPEVVTLVELNRLRATFYLPTGQAMSLEVNRNFKLTITDTQQVMVGRVEYIGPTTQADSGRVRVDFIIDNPQGSYRSGLRCVLQPFPSSAEISSAPRSMGAENRGQR